MSAGVVCLICVALTVNYAEAVHKGLRPGAKTYSYEAAAAGDQAAQACARVGGSSFDQAVARGDAQDIVADGNASQGARKTSSSHEGQALRC
eukprot:3091214-Karenia_brevis.AAC.1